MSGFPAIYTPQKTLNSEIFVKKPEDLSGVLSSEKVYVIDGVIDMGTTSIIVPAEGLNIAGLGFGISKLISSEDNYTMFTYNLASYAGNLFETGVEYEVTGSNSKVYDLDNKGNFHSVEKSVVNFNNCTSLGTLKNYRQGLEINTGRFGGTPTLTLEGVWVGGYRATTSIIRSLDSGMTEPVFKKGTSFTMQSRFLTDINCDLPALAPFADFESSNFPNSSTLQIQNAIFTRNGASNAEDTNILPNISKASISSIWKNNQGLENTYVGGTTGISTETATVISVIGTYVDINGTWTTEDLEHFDNPVGGQLRHLGTNPRDFKFIADFSVDSTQNNDLSLKVVKWDSSSSSFVDILTQRRQVNHLAGGRDVAFFNINTNLTLDQGDYVFLQGANNSSTANLIAELDSYFIVEGR